MATRPPPARRATDPRSGAAPAPAAPRRRVTPEYLLMLMTSGRRAGPLDLPADAVGPVAAILRSAQGAAGNQAVAAMAGALAPAAADLAGGLPGGPAEAPSEGQPSDRLAEAPDPDRPGPADPAGTPADPATGGPEVPPHSPTPAAAVPGGVPRSAGGGGGGGAAAVPAEADPAAVVDSAAATATAMPHPPTRPAPASPAPARSPPSRAAAARRIPGPPPVPTLEPSFANVPDPIAPATRRIEEAANRLLPEQALPPLTASPGGHMPVVLEQPISNEERRLIMLGEPAMNRAGLSRPGDPATPGAAPPGSERARLLEIRTRILAPIAPAVEGAPAAPPVPSLSVRTPPMPAADVTLAEQELFTALLARLTVDADESARNILKEIKGAMTEYPGGALNDEEHPGLVGLGRDQLPLLRTRLTDRVNAAARTMGAAGAMLDQAVTARRHELEEDAAARAEHRDTTSASAIAAAETAARSRFDAAATARATAEEARRRARPGGRAPVPDFRAQAEAAVTRIQAKVSEAIAGFRLQKTERDRELDSARDRIISAYELAVSADEVAAQDANGVGPLQTPPSDADALNTARRRVSAAVNQAREWRDREVAALRSAVLRFKAAADATTTANITEVENQGAAAFRDLRDWGATQEGAGEQWWQDSVANLERWAGAAHDTANTWAEAEARLARLEMQRDVGRIRADLERSIAEDAENAAGYARMTEDQKRDFVVRTISTSRRPNFLDQLSTRLMARQIAAERETIEPIVVSQLTALPKESWLDVEHAARAKNSNFSARTKGEAIYAAGANLTWRTNEAQIYENLEGLRPIELQAVTKFYNNMRQSDTALYDDLHGEFSGDEWRRAQALMAGDPVAAAVEAIHDAAWGPGTNEAQILAALRSIDTLPEEQRATARTRLNQLYQTQYGESIQTVLSGEMEGSELGQAEALSEGRADDALAFEMDVALDGGLNRDPAQAAAIFERIRSETMARAQAEGWTSAEFDAEVARRNRVLETRFGEHFRNAPRYGWGEGTTLQNAIGYSFGRDRGAYDMVNGLARGDMAAVDAGRMEAERGSNYADDEVVGAAVRVQFTRALERVQLDLAPELRTGIDARLRREEAEAARTDRPWNGADVIDRRMALTREMDATLADAAFDRSRESVARLDRRLTERYGLSLDQMLTQTMSDNIFGQRGALSDARARLEIMRRNDRDNSATEMADRRIDWAYARVRYGIEGAGTNMEELRGGLTGLTRDEMRILDRRWRADHDGETLRSAVESDTGGREEEDLVDTVEHGAATTAAEQVDEQRRRLRRDEASVGLVGAWASSGEARRSHEALDQLEAMSARLNDRSLSPERRASVIGAFNQRLDNSRAAIEAQRAEVDSYADAFTTVLQYVVGAVAAVAGIVAGIVTGGAAVPALIAIAASVFGTLSSMAAKAAIKGGAYGADEIATDLVVGAVDLLVTLATVGAFRGSSLWGREMGRTVFSAAREGMRNYSRATIRGTLRQVAQRTVGTAAERAVEGGARRGLASRAASFGRQFITNQGNDLVTALPTAIAANMMNEENWRGNMFAKVAHGTVEASIENLKAGMIMGIGGSAVHAGLGRFMHVEHRPLTPIEARARELRLFRELNPSSSHADFVAHLEAQQAEASAHAEVVRAAVREARQELLADLPASERGAIADVPILHVGEAQFRSLNMGNYGDALIHVHEGQAVIVVREGAPAMAVRGLAGDLRQIVAPGTAGRTVNPRDSLPPRLRNRIESVRVVRRPGFDLDGVAAVPIRNERGHIIGVGLEIGPNARAADIQNHVETIDAMRKLAGVAGQARILINDIGRSLGMDLVSPRDRGHWEASLEVAKLPRIIDERMTRLAEHGLDPRRRALLMDEIAGLERQLAAERARYALGAEAPSVGYVAANRGGDQTPPGKPDLEAEAARAALRQRSSDLITEIRAQHEIYANAEQGILDNDAVGLSSFTNHARENNTVYARALNDIKARLPRELRTAIDSLGFNPSPAQMVAVHARLARSPEFAAVVGSLRRNAQTRTRLENIGSSLQRLHEHAQRREALVRARDEAQLRIRQREAEYRELGLRTWYEVEVHPDLRDPLAGWGYTIAARTAEAFALHMNGFITEIRLATEIASRGTDVVVQWGHRVTNNFADHISVNRTTGQVTVWDAKYHGTGTGNGHSDTFSEGNIAIVRQEALDFLNSGDHGLTPEVHALAVRSLEDWNFRAVTAHLSNAGRVTSPTGVTAHKATGNFRERTITYSGEGNRHAD